MKSTIIGEQKLYDITCILAIYLFSLRVVFPGIQYQIIAAILSLPYMSHILRQHKTTNTGIIIFYLYSILTFICSVFNTFFTSNGIGGCFILLSTLTLGCYCIENLDKLKYHILIILIINIIYIIYKVLILGINPNEIYESSGLSRNHGGMLLCLFAGFYCYIQWIIHNKTSILIPLLALLCAYIMVGRSSMGLLTGLFIISLYASDKKIIAIIITALIIILAIYYKQEIEILYETSSFAEHGMESSRFHIWASYFNHLSLETTFWGPETNDIPIVRDYSGNPHNSFLNLHRRIGLIPLVLFLIISIISMIKYFIHKKYYIIFIILIIYSRIFFDSDCFIGPYDFVLYTIVFYSLIKYKPIFRITKDFRTFVNNYKNAIYHHNAELQQ